MLIGGRSRRCCQHLPEVSFQDSDLTGSYMIIVLVYRNAIDLIDARAAIAQAFAGVEDVSSGGSRNLEDLFAEVG